MIYVLDTSMIGFVEQAHPVMMRHLDEVSLREEDKVVTTIITVDEVFSGWLPLCHRAPSGTMRAKAYARLQKSLDTLRFRTCLPFDDKAAVIFDQLRAQKIRIGTNDLAIAAITLSVSGVLVTRNLVDFEKIPSLTLEDWSR